MNRQINRLISYFFFSNIYLGIIAVALCIETNLQAGISLNYLPFYGVIFLGTCLYYTMIYVRNVKAVHSNERTLWYRRNLPAIIITVKFIIAGVALFTATMLFRNRHRLFSLSAGQFLLMALFPLLAAWYTFRPPAFFLKNIRQAGMIKPFIIGLTWSGFVAFYPVFIWQVQRGAYAVQPMYPSVWLWLQNFIFISILAIIFDIKDYCDDALHNLRTFPVALGIRQTMMRVVFPLFLVNVLVFVMYEWQQHFSIYQGLVQAVPYLLLLIVIFRHRKPASLLYYLAGIDGLMLLKAVCGIAVILF